MALAGLMMVQVVLAGGGKVRGWLRREPTRTLMPLWTATPQANETPEAPQGQRTEPPSQSIGGPACVIDWSLPRNYENAQLFYQCAALLYPNDLPQIPCPPIGNVWGESLWPPYCRVIDFPQSSRTPYAYPGPFNPTLPPYPAPSTPLPYP